MTWTRSVRELFSQRVGFYWNRTLASSITLEFIEFKYNSHAHTHTHTHSHGGNGTASRKVLWRLEWDHVSTSGE